MPFLEVWDAVGAVVVRDPFSPHPETRTYLNGSLLMGAARARVYRGTSLIRKRTPLGPYRTSRVLQGS